MKIKLICFSFLISLHYTFKMSLSYALDEAQFAFMTALLKRKDLKECYYWLNELNAMGETALKTFLIQLYYDFYYALQPEFILATATATLANLVRELFVCQASPLVFLLRQVNSARPKIRYIQTGPTARWLLKYEERFHMFLRALHKNHYHSIPYYVDQLLNTQTASVDELNEVLCSYYKVTSPPLVANTGDPLHSVLCIYARFHLANTMTTANTMMTANNTTPEADEYSLPPEIASFHLQRWRTDVETDIMKRLRYDPILIAMALASVYETNVVTDYIKSQLSDEERDQALFTKNATLTTPAEHKSIFDEVVAEQAEHYQAHIAKNYPDVPAEVVAKKHPMLLPAFGAVWLKAVFPSEAQATLLDLVTYKLLHL